MNNVLEIPKFKIAGLINYLRESGFEEKETGTGTAFRTKDAVVTVYKTGKVLFQGKNFVPYYKSVIEFAGISEAKEPTVSPRLKENSQSMDTRILPRVGSDESGKGDFFGSLVTCAYLLPSEEDEEKLLALGVKDSKKLSDKQIKQMVSGIKKLGKHSIVRVGPEKYNKLYTEFRNVNKLLAWSHARAIENVLADNRCELIVADQFGDAGLIENALFKQGKQVRLYQRHGGEADTAVASASILARDAFVSSLAKLSQDIGFDLPLGSGDRVLETGVKIAKHKGLNFLETIAKIHFRTYDTVRSRL